MKVQGPMNRTVVSVMFILLLSLATRSSYGTDNGEKPQESITGFNVEVSATRNRGIVNMGLFTADRDLLLHAGLFGVKPKEGASRYGVDIGAGVPFPLGRIWPFVEVGVEVGTSTSIVKIFSAVLYPKIGVAVPVSDQMWVYAGYLYSFSTEGRNSDYSAASFGFVWAM